ncbi:MAG: helix-turn-helix transcriptional regulator [Rhizobiaceae bacterium]|nr:helix-turn-helix transcriptional regulator [Rhizobiaceae bacterium]
MSKLTPQALRAARAILNWSMRDLAGETGLSFSTIAKIESGSSPREKTEKVILDAFARHNVEITNGEGTGARLLFEK